MNNPRSLADQVYEQLRADIVSGRIPSSEKLVELDIAETHRPVVTAIRSGDPEAAARAIE
jgi:DNA-binding GntR family transcriptional regulator